jgi:hypothetical protein
MARIVSIIQFTGRVGSAVGSKGKGGKVLLRQYQPSVSNPRTDAQMSQRAKMKLAAQVAGMLGEVGRTALIANGYKKTDRGMLIKRLLKSVVVNQDGSQASLQYDLQLVDNPSYREALSMTITSTSNAYVASFSGASEGEVIAKCIMVHDLSTGLWRHTASLNANTSISLGKSVSEAGHALEVFAYGIVLEPKTEDARNSLSQVGANQAGFVLDLNKVSTTSFDFSPTISAALAVEGDGSTTGGSGSSAGSSTGSETGGGQTVTVAAPTISGTTPFAETTQVTMSAESGAEIRYTTDGSTPTSSSTLYSAALTLSDTTTVKAIAIKNGTSSSVASQTFTKSSGGGGTDPEDGDVG